MVDRSGNRAPRANAAQGTLELHDAQAMILGVLITTGQGLRQATHRVTGTLIERA
jgi:hypothetical protein